jgi:hypothetical protein
VIHKVGIAFLSGSIRSQKSSFHQFYNWEVQIHTKMVFGFH